MSMAILGLGTAVPPTAVTRTDAAEIARRIARCTPDQAQVIDSLYAHAGIETRHLSFAPQLVQDVLHDTRESRSVFLPEPDPGHHGPTTAQRLEHYKHGALPLAVEAARRALADAEVEIERLTHLITVSCTGFYAPGVDYGLIEKLGLSRTIERTHVGFMGCHAALNGIRVAQAFAASRPHAVALLCCVELCALHYHYGWNPKKLVSNALFADGAAALVGASAANAPGGAWQAVASGSCVFPKSADAMTWNIGDHGFEMTLSTRVPDLIAANVRPWLDRWLEQNALRVADIATWAIHPGGPRILRAVEQALGISPEATAVAQEVLADCGNMSSPTVLFILERLRRRRTPRPCVALGFGPGLAVEATLFR
jgi:predicted naringenin-chalcone synthase